MITSISTIINGYWGEKKFYEQGFKPDRKEATTKVDGHERSIDRKVVSAWQILYIY